MIKNILTLTAASILLASCDKVDQRKNDDKTLSDIESEMSDIKKSIGEDFEKTGEIDTEATEKVVDALAKAEKKTSGSYAESLKIARLYIEIMQNDAKLLENAMPGFENACTLTDIKSTADIDAKSKNALAYKQANLTLIQKIKTSWPTRLEQLINESKLTSSEKATIRRQMTNKLNLQRPLMIKIRETDTQLCDLILAQHKLLKDDWGQWEYIDESPTFNNEPTLEAFNNNIEKIQEVAEQQNNAQRALLKLAQ